MRSVRKRRFFVRALILGLLLSPGGMIHASPVRADASIKIGEVNWAGSSLSTADEWIELWNLSDAPFSLDGFRLTGAGGANGIPFGPNDVIEPRSAFVVSNYGENETKSALAIAPNVVTTTVSLPNDKLGISLIDPNGTILDVAGDGLHAPPAGLSGTIKISMIRIALDAGDTSAAWTSATTSQNFKSEIADLGTPGICDGCRELTPVPDSYPIDDTIAPDPTPVPEPVTILEASSTTELPANEPVVVTEASSTDPVIEAVPVTEPEATTTAETTEPITTVSDSVQIATPTDNGPQLPTASFAITGDLTVSSTILFDASASHDPNGDFLQFTWDFGDGTTATSVQATHIYHATGTYPMSVSVYDGEFTDVASTTLTIAEPPTLEETPIDEGFVAVSSTVPDTDTTVENATSTETASEPPSNNEPAPLTNAATVTSTPSPLPINIRLNEIFPAPSDGPEWIELSGMNAINDLLGWTISDAQNVIFRFSSTTLATMATNNTYLSVPLTGSHLNNTGDTVSLRDGNGVLIDETTYPSMAKDSTWVRHPDMNGPWEVSLTSTPSQPNVFASPTPPTPADHVTSSTPSPSMIVITQTIPSKPVTLSRLTSLAASSTAHALHAAPVITKPAAPKTTKVTPKPKAAKTTKAKASSSTAIKQPLYSATIAMAPQLPSQTRVSLLGTVASVPQLLGKNLFVLVSEDGRGLLIYGNGKQPSPAFGSAVRVSGGLIINDDGASLHMTARDQWSPADPLNRVSTRAVDLLAPSQEDAWSFIEVTGTVARVTARSVELDLEDATIIVQINAAANYRSERLKAGDVIRVRGLLDTRSENIKIIPRQPDDISIIRAAAIAKASSAPAHSSLPPWTPFGAAGATVAITKGLSIVQKMREQKRLTALLQKASEELENS